jgi:hypothetical protein
MVLNWLVAIGVVVGPLASRLAGLDTLQQVAALQRAVEAAAPGTRVAVRMGTQAFISSTGRSSTQFVRIHVITWPKPASPEELADRVAAAVLSNAHDSEDIDQLVVSIAYGYDIMISSAYVTNNFSHSPREWGDRLKLDARA